MPIMCAVVGQWIGRKHPPEDVWPTGNSTFEYDTKQRCQASDLKFLISVWALIQVGC